MQNSKTSYACKTSNSWKTSKISLQNFQLRHVKAIFRGGPGNLQQERIVYEKFDLGWSKSVKTNSYPLVFDSYIDTNLTLLKNELDNRTIGHEGQFRHVGQLRQVGHQHKQDISTSRTSRTSRTIGQVGQQDTQANHGMSDNYGMQDNYGKQDISTSGHQYMQDMWDKQDISTSRTSKNLG